MGDGPSVGERIARTLAGACFLAFGIGYVASPWPLGLFCDAGLVAFVGLFAMGLAVAGAGLVALATHRLPGGPRRAGPLVAYAGAAAGMLVLFWWAVRWI